MPDFKIPLAGSYNTRVTETNALSSASGIVGLGIVGIMVVGATITSTAKDQRFINCFPITVVNPYTGRRTIYTVKRPGFGVLNTPRAGSIGTAILVWTGQGAGTKVISAFGGTNSNIYDGTTNLGAITGKATRITETFVGTVATLVISSTDNTGWYYDIGTGATTKIADADFPGNAGLTLAGTFAHMDGYAFIMDTAGNIWNSDLNSVTAWSATSSIPANSYPDRGVGCVRLRDKIMAFGTESTQFFYNNGNPTGSPLSRNESLTLRLGCVSADAIASIVDTVFWCGSGPEGGLQVHSYSGGYKKISTPEIEAILILAGAANISITTIELWGRSFVIVNAGTVTFVYCVEENGWHEWNSSTNRLWYKCAGVSSGSTQVFYSVSNITTSGKVYTINPSSLVFQDDGMAFTARIQLSKLGDGTRRTSWDVLWLLGDQQTSSCPVDVSYSDDDYQTYNLLGTIDMGSSADQKITPVGGSAVAKERAWVFTNSSNTPLRLEAMAGRQTVSKW